MSSTAKAHDDCATHLARLGLPAVLGVIFAGSVDWPKAVALVERGLGAEVAIRNARRNR